MTEVSETKRSSVFSEEEINDIFESVLRESTAQPGFYYKDLGADLDSKSFREVIFDVKERLSDLCEKRLNKQLNYHWLSRANHRNSSNFHIDTAPEHSILILGYEPTSVESKVFLADYTKYLEAENLSAQDYFRNSFNGNFAQNDEELAPYVSETTPFPKDHCRLVIINNSRSYGQKSYGVFHRGEVSDNLDQRDRVVNRVMVNLCDVGVEESNMEEMISNFMNSDLAAQ